MLIMDSNSFSVHNNIKIIGEKIPYTPRYKLRNCGTASTWRREKIMENNNDENKTRSTRRGTTSELEINYPYTD